MFSNRVDVQMENPICGNLLTLKLMNGLTSRQHTSLESAWCCKHGEEYCEGILALDL